MMKVASETGSPRNAVVLRQNWGLRRGFDAGIGGAGAVGSCDMV